MENNSKLLLVTTFIIIILGAITIYQNKVITKMQNLIELIDTTTTVKTDTLYLDKFITDTIPTVKYQTIIKYDTLYEKTDSNTIGEPVLITLKKKITQIP